MRLGLPDSAVRWQRVKKEIPPPTGWCVAQSADATPLRRSLGPELALSPAHHDPTAVADRPAFAIARAGGGRRPRGRSVWLSGPVRLAERRCPVRLAVAGCSIDKPIPGVEC